MTLTEEEMKRLIGKASCFRHYEVMFKNMGPVKKATVMVMSQNGLEGQEPDPDKLHEFAERLIVSGRLAEWVKANRGDCEPAEFDLDVDPTAKDDKTDKVFEVPEGMADAVLAEMQSKENLGHFQRIMKTEAEE